MTTPNLRIASTSILAASAGLLELGGATIPTPERPFIPNPRQQEEAIEERMYAEVPAADGSEDEYENEEETLEETIECVTHEFEERAALDDNGDLIPSGDSQQPLMFGAPISWKPPSAPANWTRPARKVNKGEPVFSSVDNPGNWSN